MFKAVHTSHLMRPPAERVFGGTVSVDFEAIASRGRQSVDPGESVDVTVVMPRAGVPVDCDVGVPGLKVTRMLAEDAQIIDVDSFGSATDLFKAGRVRAWGVACQEGTEVDITVRNDLSVPTEFSIARLVCAIPPFVELTEDSPSMCSEEAFLKDVGRFWSILPPPDPRRRAFMHLRGVKILDLIDCTHHRNPKCRYCGRRQSDSRSVEAESSCLAGDAPELLVLAVLMSAELGDFYRVKAFGVGEKATFRFENVESPKIFSVGSEYRPPMPFILLPPRQTLSVWGERIVDEPVPPFEGKLVCAMVVAEEET
jgi:hypothetical protein